MTNVFFVFSLLHFEVNSVVSMPEKPNILEIRYIAVQYSKDVFIYLSRASAVKNVLRQRHEIGVFARGLTENEQLIIYFGGSEAKTTNFISPNRYVFDCIPFSRLFPVSL